VCAHADVETAGSADIDVVEERTLVDRRFVR